LLVTRNVAPKGTELSRPVPNPRLARGLQRCQRPPPAEQPIYRVLFATLTFDANAPEKAPDPDPAHILMVREARHSRI